MALSPAQQPAHQVDLVRRRSRVTGPVDEQVGVVGEVEQQGAAVAEVDVLVGGGADHVEAALLHGQAEHVLA